MRFGADAFAGDAGVGHSGLIRHTLPSAVDTVSFQRIRFNSTPSPGLSDTLTSRSDIGNSPSVRSRCNPDSLRSEGPLRPYLLDRAQGVGLVGRLLAADSDYPAKGQSSFSLLIFAGL
jgi:hypothetical protein